MQHGTLNSYLCTYLYDTCFFVSHVGSDTGALVFCSLWPCPIPSLSTACVDALLLPPLSHRVLSPFSRVVAGHPSCCLRRLAFVPWTEPPRPCIAVSDAYLLVGKKKKKGCRHDQADVDGADEGGAEGARGGHHACRQVGDVGTPRDVLFGTICSTAIGFGVLVRAPYLTNVGVWCGVPSSHRIAVSMTPQVWLLVARASPSACCGGHFTHPFKATKWHMNHVLVCPRRLALFTPAVRLRDFQR